MVSTSLILIGYLVTSSWSLSQEQVIERDFSGRQAIVEVQGEVPPGDSRLLRTVQSTARGASVTVVSTGVRLSGQSDLDVLYQEADWSATQYGYELTSGRWPSRPGEVALTAGLTTSDGDELSLLSDRARVRVVGNVDDAYSDSPRILAGPGTWQSLPPGSAKAHEGLSAAITLPTTRTGADQLEAALKQRRIHTAVRMADQADRDGNWVADSPFSFLVPAITVPITAVGMAIASGRKAQRTLVRRVVEVGGRRKSALAMVRGALLASVLLGLVVGLLAGWGLGRVVVPVASLWNDRAAGPYPSLPGPFSIITVSALVGLALSTARLRLPATTHTPTTRAARSPSRRRWTALLSGCATLIVASRISSPTGAMVVGTGVLLTLVLLVPDLVRALARILDRPAPHWRIGARLLAADRGVSAEIVLTTVVLALPLTLVVLLTTTGSTARSNALAEVGPGQLLVTSAGGLGKPAPEEVRAAVRETLRGSDAVTATVLYGTVDAWYEVFTGNASVIAVETADDVERVWGTPLTSAQRATLDSGGALVWQPGHEFLVDGKRPSPSIPLTTYQPVEEWAHATGAVMLKPFAEERGITLDPGGTVYANVSSDDNARVVAAIRARGLDQSTIHDYHPPEELVPPAVLIASALVLTALMLGITAVAAHTRTASLRRIFGQIIAIGAGLSVVRRTQVLTQTVVATISVTGALLVTGTAVTVMLLRNSSAEVNPPWRTLLALVLALTAAQLAASALALRRLRPESIRDS